MENKKNVYHYKKKYQVSKEILYQILFNTVVLEFTDFDEELNPHPVRKTKLTGYHGKKVCYKIQLVSFEKDSYIEIHSNNGQEVYITRYEFEEIKEGQSIFHVLERMESDNRRISLNYTVLSWIIKLGKKQKWKQIIAMIDDKLKEKELIFE